MEIKELSNKAEKVIALNEKMKETFSNNDDAHLKLAIMCGLKDAYSKGKSELNTEDKYPFHIILDFVKWMKESGIEYGGSKSHGLYHDFKVYLEKRNEKL